jgi:uroporphyrinogen decarboxylase
MDSRTRVRAALECQPLDRIPRYDSFWEDTLGLWRSQGMPADVTPEELFDFDMRIMYLDASLRCPQRILRTDDLYVTFQDRAGYTARKTVGKSRAMEWIDHVTKDRATWNALRHGFQFDPAAPARIDTESYFYHLDEYPTWQEAKRRFDVLRATNKYVVFNVYGPWEGTWRHRGYTRLLMDLAEEPGWVAEMAESQCELVLACLQHCIRLEMKPDALWLVDDLACTRGPLFSPRTWREVFGPSYARLGHFLHENDISFWLHCCGDCRVLLDDLVEYGLNVLQPLQARAGMDVRELKPRYGGNLAFWGNIDVGKLSGPADQCEEELREKIMSAKQGGGYMYHSDHSVPPEVSFARYQWIMELLDKYGCYL